MREEKNTVTCGEEKNIWCHVYKKGKCGDMHVRMTGMQFYSEKQGVCCAPSMQPPQRLHIASVMMRCSGYLTLL
jgi:hypothetical protein